VQRIEHHREDHRPQQQVEERIEDPVAEHHQRDDQPGTDQDIEQASRDGRRQRHGVFSSLQADDRNVGSVRDSSIPTPQAPAARSSRAKRVSAIR